MPVEDSDPTPVIEEAERETPYRTVNFAGEIVAGIAGLIGVNVVDGDVGNAQAQNIAARVNSWLRRGWEDYPFTELVLTEQRSYWPVYYPELNYSAGTRLYFAPEEGADGYFQAQTTIAPGESPAANPEKWEQFQLPVGDRRLSFQQWGQQWIDTVIGIYPYDPRTVAQARTVPFLRTGTGLVTTAWSGNLIWITYRPQQPVFTHEAYDAERTYDVGELVQDAGSPEAAGTGDCFRSLHADNLDNPPGEQNHWYRQLFPYLLAEYVKYGAASDLAEDRGTRADYRAEAILAMDSAVARDLEQGGRFPANEPKRYAHTGYVTCLPGLATTPS